MRHSESVNASQRSDQRVQVAYIMSVWWLQMPRMKLAPMAGHVSRLTPEAAWAAAWIEAQDLVKQLQAAIARGDVALRGRGSHQAHLAAGNHLLAFTSQK